MAASAARRTGSAVMAMVDTAAMDTAATAMAAADAQPAEMR
jgi:hypothetical protein